MTGNKIELLRIIDFGSRVAEEETDVLSSYFVETDHGTKCTLHC
jgi:hypothetical protein